MEEIITITDLFIYRGTGIEGLLEKYGNNEKVRLIKLILNTNQSGDYVTEYQIGPLTVKQNKSLYMNKTLYKKDLENLIKYQINIYEQIKKDFQDYDFEERTYCEKLYLEDKETHNVAEFKLVSKDEKIPTLKFLTRGIQSINPLFKCPLEFSGKLFNLWYGKLKKIKELKRNERTKPQLLRYIPNIYEATYAKTCELGVEIKTIPKELSCRFDGETPKEVEDFDVIEELPRLR